MNEEGVDAGGKVGMSRKLVAGIIVAVVVAAGLGAAVLWQLRDGGNSTTYSMDIYWNYVDASEALHLTVVDIQGPESLVEKAPMGALEFLIVNNTSNLWIEEFYGFQLFNGSNVHGMQWMDQDSDGILENGDYLRINKTYGVNGNIDLNGHSIQLRDSGYFNHHPRRIYVPPAEFLDMDVVKTATGWNMTVTWVNGTVPINFLEDGNISFRLENRSGDFFTTRDNEYSVRKFHTFGLWLIDDIRGEYDRFDYNDMGFYNVTWYDNDKNGGLSVNDIFIIDNYDDLIEPGFKFRLICEKYGWVHTIYELTFE